MPHKKAAVVLAAGKGKRMVSEIPKVLHLMNNRPMIKFLLDTLVKMDFDKIIVVIGFKGEMVQKELADYPVSFVWQKEQLGTGHAVMMAEDLLSDFDGTTLVVLGDVPLLSESSISHLLEKHFQAQVKATCLSALLDNPQGYGRIIRKGNTEFIKEIIEDKDASEEVLKIKEINSGTFCFDNHTLFNTLSQLDNNNSQGEYYLTDCVKALYNKNLEVLVVNVENADEILGVNSMEQLKYLERKITGEKK